MRKYPGTEYYYCEGEKPDYDELSEDEELTYSEDSMTRDLPSDWPNEEVDVFGPEVNHRNVDLYHMILNNTTDLVEGAGSFFQTWISDKHSAIQLDPGIGESFAFLNNQLPELLDLAKKVTVESLQFQFSNWCKNNKEEHEVSIEESIALFEDFQYMIPGLEKAIENNSGIVWITC